MSQSWQDPITVSLKGNAFSLWTCDHQTYLKGKPFVNNLILGSFHFVLNLNKSILLFIYCLVSDLIWVVVESEIFWGAMASFCTTTMTSHKLVDCNDAQFVLQRKIKISIQLLSDFVNNRSRCKQYIIFVEFFGQVGIRTIRSYYKYVHTNLLRPLRNLKPSLSQFICFEKNSIRKQNDSK